MQLADFLDEWYQQLAAGSTLPTALVAVGLLVLLVPVLRRLVFDMLETIVASLLLLVLVVVVLGLPFGKLSSSLLALALVCVLMRECTYDMHGGGHCDITVTCSH